MRYFLEVAFCWWVLFVCLCGVFFSFSPFFFSFSRGFCFVPAALRGSAVRSGSERRWNPPNPPLMRFGLRDGWEGGGGGRRKGGGQPLCELSPTLCPPPHKDGTAPEGPCGAPNGAPNGALRLGCGRPTERHHGVPNAGLMRVSPEGPRGAPPPHPAPPSCRTSCRSGRPVGLRPVSPPPFPHSTLTRVGERQHPQLGVHP